MTQIGNRLQSYIPSRRTFLRTTVLSGVLTHVGYALDPSADPWPAEALLEPGDLAKIVRGGRDVPTLISVAFPVLYRQRHIVHSFFAGPTSKPEGLATLTQTAAPLSKNGAIVLYCGCCPMVHCPNIRPAFSLLKDLGYRNVRVLNLPTNLRTDWTDKGYPVEPASNGS